MSGVRGSTADIVAIGVSDLHLTDKAPIAREGESNWWDVMSRALQNVTELASEYDVPVFVAGDIFDKWNASAELINFALDNLTECYAVPGQHDLSYHNYSQMERTAFGVLVNAGKVHLLEPGKSYTVGPKIIAHGFPWGFKPPEGKRIVVRGKGILNVAVCHAYCWMGDHKYPDAPMTASVSSHRRAFKDFDALLFGDNHKGFIANMAKPYVANTGAFIARKTDEREYNPFIALLHADGKWSPVGTYEENAVWSTEHIDKLREREQIEEGFQKFIKSLQKSKSGGVDFEETCLRAAASLGKGVKQMVLQILDDVKS